MLSALYKLEFYERYVGILSDYDIAQELKTNIDDIRSIKKEFSSPCWSCRNACNGNKCSWVKTGIYPPFVTITEDGRFAGCLNYEHG